MFVGGGIAQFNAVLGLMELCAADSDAGSLGSLVVSVNQSSNAALLDSLSLPLNVTARRDPIAISSPLGWSLVFSSSSPSAGLPWLVALPALQLLAPHSTDATAAGANVTLTAPCRASTRRSWCSFPVCCRRA